MRVVDVEPSLQPHLPEVTFPERQPDGTVKRLKFRWPAQTRQWWRMWAESPLARDFTETDWSELLDTALLHARYWQGNLSLASEIRLRVAKFGATPEDRARLRIVFAVADNVEQGGSKPQGTGQTASPYLGLAAAD